MEKEILDLCARPSFFEGVARLFDFGGTLNHYKYSKTSMEADYRAILSDWRHVGYDLRTAMQQYSDLYLKGMDGRIE